MNQFSHSHKVESLSKMVTMQAEKLQGQTEKLQGQTEAFKAIRRMLRQGRLVAVMGIVKKILKEG